MRSLQAHEHGRRPPGQLSPDAEHAATCAFDVRERKQELLHDRSGELRSQQFPYAARADRPHRRSWRLDRVHGDGRGSFASSYESYWERHGHLHEAVLGTNGVLVERTWALGECC